MKQGTRLYINITNSCNLDCPFCCMYSGTNKHHFMSFNIFKNIIDSTEGKFELQLEGGEPLLHKELYLFIEYAISTNRCDKIIILTNSLLLDKHIDRILQIGKWYQNIDFEIKASVNYYTLKNINDQIEMLERIQFAIQYIPFIHFKLNIRKRKGVDEDIDKLISDHHLSEISNSYYLQSYGKLLGSNYEKPIIVQNIENWKLYASDGTCYDQDLILRSEHENTL